MKNLIALAVAAPLVALALTACTIGDTKSDDTSADTGRDVNNPDGGGGNPGGGGDGGGSDTADTSDSGGFTSDLECDGQDNSAAAGPDCVTGTIRCGQTIEATTQNGTSQLDEEFYQSAYCFVPFQSYDGPERVYALEVDGGGDPVVISVNLEAPCGDLSLAMFYWDDTSECPVGAQHNVANCDGEEAGTNITTSTYTTGETPDRYLVAVDGSSEAAFRLSVICDQ